MLVQPRKTRPYITERMLTGRKESSQTNKQKSPMCTSDGLDSCMTPGFWQTLVSIAEVRYRYCSEIEPCKWKPMDQKFQVFCLYWQPGRGDEVVTTGRSHGLKFEQGTIYIVHFHTGSYRKDW